LDGYFDTGSNATTITKHDWVSDIIPNRGASTRVCCLTPLFLGVAINLDKSVPWQIPMLREILSLLG
jgi:hypothetical protein